MRIGERIDEKELSFAPDKHEKRRACAAPGTRTRTAVFRHYRHAADRRGGCATREPPHHFKVFHHGRTGAAGQYCHESLSMKRRVFLQINGSFSPQGLSSLNGLSSSVRRGQHHHLMEHPCDAAHAVKAS